MGTVLFKRLFLENREMRKQLDVIYVMKHQIEGQLLHTAKVVKRHARTRWRPDTSLFADDHYHHRLQGGSFRVSNKFQHAVDDLS